MDLMTNILLGACLTFIGLTIGYRIAMDRLKHCLFKHRKINIECIEDNPEHFGKLEPFYRGGCATIEHIYIDMFSERMGSD